VISARVPRGIAAKSSDRPSSCRAEKLSLRNRVATRKNRRHLAGGATADPEEQCGAPRNGSHAGRRDPSAFPRICARLCLLRDVMHYSRKKSPTGYQFSVVAVRLRLFRARRRLAKTWSRGSAQARSSKGQYIAPSRPIGRREPRRQSLLALNAAIGFASGD